MKAQQQRDVPKKEAAKCQVEPFLNAQNLAPTFAAKILQSQMAFTSGALQVDYKLLSSGHAFYLSHCMCAANDFSILLRLVDDLEKNNGASMIQWSRHLKHENPSFSPTFMEIINRMAAHFDVEVYASRLNFYPDSSSWKPFHHDSHAYAGPGKKEDFTMGASFGATRELVFMHPKSGGQQFSFPQKNGDVFAFDSVVNERFMHGVPRATTASSAPAPRFSIIAWGRRRSFNLRNAGKEDIGKKTIEAREESESKEQSSPAITENSEGKEQVMSMKDVRDSVQKFLQAHAAANPSPPAQSAKPAAPKTSRMQQGNVAGRVGKAPAAKGGGWSSMKKAAPKHDLVVARIPANEAEEEGDE